MDAILERKYWSRFLLLAVAAALTLWVGFGVLAQKRAIEHWRPSYRDAAELRREPLLARAVFGDRITGAAATYADAYDDLATATPLTATWRFLACNGARKEWRRCMPR